MAMGRGIPLVALAFLIGLALLNRVDSKEPGDQVETGSSDTTSTTAVGGPVEPEVTTTTAAPRAPREVRVLTANGTDVKGAGGRIKDRLMAAGYNTLAATDTKAKATESAVYFAVGYEREAAKVAEALGLAPTTVKAVPAPPPVADLKAANVLVVVGPDLASAGATTTTARSGTASTTTTTARSGATSSTTSTTARR